MASPALTYVSWWLGPPTPQRHERALGTLVANELLANRSADPLDLRPSRLVRALELSLEPPDPPPRPLQLRLELHYAFDARQVESELGGELLNALQPADVLLGVETGVLR